MIVKVSIERVADEGEDHEELEKLPFGCGITTAVFDYDPKTKDYDKYLDDLGAATLSILQHEAKKANIHQIIKDKENENVEE